MNKTLLTGTIGLSLLGQANIANAVLMGNALEDRQYPSDYATFPQTDNWGPFVVDFHVSQSGATTSVVSWGQDGSAGRSFYAYILRPLGGTEYLVAGDSGRLTVTAGIGIQTFSVASWYLQPGDLIAHFGQGIPFDNYTHPGTSSVLYEGYNRPTLGDVIDLSLTPGAVAAYRVYSVALDMTSGSLDWDFPPLPGNPAGGGETPVPESPTGLTGMLATISTLIALVARRKNTALQQVPKP